MRRLSLALALSFVAPAGAEALDCGGMKSSAQPFELTIDSTGKSVGKDPVAMPMRRQVIRKIDETVVFDIFSPSRVLRRTFAANGLLTEVIGADDKTPRVASYSIDMAKDYFALGKPFDFNVVMKTPDGQANSEVNTSVSFDGEVEMELGGCVYPLTKIVESNHGAVKGKAVSNRVEFWYSRDLKTSLYSRLEGGDGYVLELRARDISTSFAPVE